MSVRGHIKAARVAVAILPFAPSASSPASDSMRLRFRAVTAQFGLERNLLEIGQTIS